MPGTLRITMLAFAVLAVLFALAFAHRLLADGSLGATAFFAVLSAACAVAAGALATRRTWAPIPAYALASLLAAASLGLFGAITLVGLALLAWVLWALNTRPSREWLSRRRR